MADLSAAAPIQNSHNFPLNKHISSNHKIPSKIIEREANHNVNHQPPIIVNQVQPHSNNIIVIIKFGTKPVPLFCKFCKKNITTNVSKSWNFGSCFLCYCTSLIFWIFIQSCQGKELNCWDAKHTCPNCGQILGIYESC